MISSLTAARLWSQQTALNAFKQASEGSSSGNSSSSNASSSLADYLFTSDDDGSDDETSLSDLIKSLQGQATTGGATAADTSEGSADDISSASFMKALQGKLESLKENPDTSAMAESMLAALKAGTLTATDVVSGTQIKAWDVSDNTIKPSEQTSVDQTDWPTFLKEHLERDSTAKYVRNEDSSHREKVTGASAYFGMIGETYYYLSWTAPAATPTDAAQSSAAPLD
ncbi:hypothetical protein [Rhizobium sp. RAF56]|uniref:hypothetical protein n=1 Tax=Rhizobium sp. RAF56 TaxID=3233062 RepID=UPI003F95BA3C